MWHRRTHRVARDDELGCVGDVFAGNLIGERDGSGLLAQEFIRHAHDGILFMHNHRHVQLLGRHAHRNGHISPKADNGIGTNFAHPRLRLAGRAQNFQRRGDERMGTLAIEPRSLESHKRNVGLADQARLNALRRASEKHFVVAFL